MRFRGRLGPLNEETKYVLKRFGLENPLLLKDARSQLRDIDIDEPTLITTKTSLKEAWDVLFKARNKSLFVLDEQQKLTGIVSTSNLASPRMMSDELMHKLMKTASLSALAKTINGEIDYEPKNFKTNGKVFIVTLNDGTKFEENFRPFDHDSLRWQPQAAAAAGNGHAVHDHHMQSGDQPGQS